MFWSLALSDEEAEHQMDDARNTLKGVLGLANEVAISRGGVCAVSTFTEIPPAWCSILYENVARATLACSDRCCEQSGSEVGIRL